jgi:hypothetical protein
MTSNTTLTLSLINTNLINKFGANSEVYTDFKTVILSEYGFDLNTKNITDFVPNEHQNVYLAILNYWNTIAAGNSPLYDSTGNSIATQVKLIQEKLKTDPPKKPFGELKFSD